MATLSGVVVVRRSEAVLFTSRHADHENETVGLTLRAGLVRRFGSGLYGFTPTGERVRRNVCDHIEQEMAAIGGQAVDLPSLQYKPAWEQSGRWGSFEGEMFTLENREGKQMCLAPSHEESVVELVEGVVRSYDDLPLLFYQVGKKHRDDHARGGLLRTKEFTMKDAYSLHAGRKSLDEYYERVRSAYIRIFESLDIDFSISTAENSVMGGPESEEFLAPSKTGTVGLSSCTEEDCRFGVTDDTNQFQQHDGGVCPDCGGTLRVGEGIEIGHVFKLGTRYSDAMGLSVDTTDDSRSVLMGSYGIGIERLIHTLIEQHAEVDGCRWPTTDTGSIGPYAVSIIPLEYSDKAKTTADRIHRACGPEKTLLFDDPDQTIGTRFAESDLIGIPWKVIIGNNFERTGKVDVERRTGETTEIEPNAVSTLVGQ